MPDIYFSTQERVFLQLSFGQEQHTCQQVIFAAAVFVAALKAQGLLHSGSLKAATTGAKDQSFSEAETTHSGVSHDIPTDMGGAFSKKQKQKKLNSCELH